MYTIIKVIQTQAVNSILEISNRALACVRTITVHTSGIDRAIVSEIVTFIVICSVKCLLKMRLNLLPIFSYAPFRVTQLDVMLIAL